VKTYIVFLFLILIFFKVNIIAQPIIQWQKSLGGSEDDIASSLELTKSNGFVIVGSTQSRNGDVSNHHTIFTDSDIWLVNLDSLGILISEKCLGGSGTDDGYSLVSSILGYNVIAGRTTSNDLDVSGLHGNARDYWVVKTDSTGQIIWQKCYGGTATDEAIEVIQSLDGGYFVVGQATSNDGDVVGSHGFFGDIWAVKIDSAGTKQWTKVLGGTAFEDAASCIQTPDSGFLIVGRTVSTDGDVTGLHGSSVDVWIVKLNNQGQLLWQKCYGGTALDYPNKIISTDNGSFIVSATANSIDGDVSGIHGQNDFWLFKADSIGNIIWQKCYGGQFIESSRSASATSDGGIIITGISNADDGMVSGNHGLFDFWLVKVDSLGNYQWSKCLGGTQDDEPFAVKETPDGGYIVAGSTLSSDGDVTFNHGNKDVWVVKLAPLGLTVSEAEKNIYDLTLTQNNNQIYLRYFSKKKENVAFRLFDLTGREISGENFMSQEGINYHQINTPDLKNGMYLIKAETTGYSHKVKIIIE
jgi:hypothetical protein